MSADNCIIILNHNNTYYVSSMSFSSWFEIGNYNEKIDYMKEFSDFKKFDNKIDAENYSEQLLNSINYVEYGIIVENVK